MAKYINPESHKYLDTQISDIHHQLIVRNMMKTLRAIPGDVLVELGAGSGRYTELLLNMGYRVIAIEPDPVLANKLTERLSAVEGLIIINANPLDRTLYPDDVKAICGFHVLHHIRNEELNELYNLFADLLSSKRFLSGWLFLEPNPLNPLYLIQICLTEGMRITEEIGIWQKYPKRHFKGARDIRGTCGWLPPRRWTGKLGQLCALGTSLSSHRMIWNSYQLIGVQR